MSTMSQWGLLETIRQGNIKIVLEKEPTACKWRLSKYQNILVLAVV